MMAVGLEEKLKNVKLVVFDIDGVLTDGRMYYTSSGDTFKAFDVLDGMGIYLLRKIGLPVAFMSAKSSTSIASRAKDCNVDIVLEDISDKGAALKGLSESMDIPLEEIAFVGDDWVDIRAMSLCGLPIAVANAHEEVKRFAKWVTKNAGGRGAAREICDAILKAKGAYEACLKEYSNNTNIS